MHALFQKIAALPWDQLPQWLFLIPGLLMLLAAFAAVCLRNLIHSALCVVLSFICLGVLFMALGAEFVGFVQLLVYVGAVAMLILFAILLTPASEVQASNNPLSNFRLSSALHAAAGAAVSFLVLAGLLAAIAFSPRAANAELPAQPAAAPVALIGENLLTYTLLPLLGIAVLLTAALVGAALIAKEDSKS
ncbi:MAG: NADH-quinone oxidoreductase subunit J [Chthoniobacteraceae bacterium]|nr:NADH-quinone oxidoreductase subunit J [Chthoniobacteraceae bacterium]